MTGPTNARTQVMQIQRPGDPSIFGDDVRVAASQIVARYPEGQSRSALLPMLHLVQSEEGYISPDGIAFCAEQLAITHAQVAAVATFYTMYKRSPTGEYLVSVCTNTLCGMLGGDEIYKTLSDTLGVGMNGTTADGTITLEHAECLAACDYAPVVTVNYEFFDNQTPETALALVDQLNAGNRPSPTRGAPLCSFKQISRQIAGFLDDRPESLEAPGAGVPTQVGVRLARARGEEAADYPNGSKVGAVSAAASASAGAATGSSANDAPLETAESDAANPARTASAHTSVEPRHLPEQKDGNA